MLCGKVNRQALLLIGALESSKYASSSVTWFVPFIYLTIYRLINTLLENGSCMYEKPHLLCHTTICVD